MTVGKSILEEHDAPRSVSIPQTERRTVRRMSVNLQHVFPVAIRCGQGRVCQGRLLNLSVHGMLAEFPNGQIPPVSVDAKVSVKLNYLGDSIWLPGLVRHRKGHKMGFYFPALTNHPTRVVKHPLTVVLHSLSRAVATSSHRVPPFSHSRTIGRVSI